MCWAPWLEPLPSPPTFLSISGRYRRFAPVFTRYIRNRKDSSYVVMLTSDKHGPGVVMRKPSSPCRVTSGQKCITDAALNIITHLSSEWAH